MSTRTLMRLGAILCAFWALGGCAFQPFAGPLLPQGAQNDGMTVHDDGSVVYQLDRFEVTLRPVTDDELNRNFAAASVGETSSTNAYTFGDTQSPGLDSTRQRFTVFHAAVKNYSYPKVRVDPVRTVLVAGNGRKYRSLSLAQMQNYYRAYAIGYRGNEYSRLRERLDLLRRTMLTDDVVFSGQESEGYLVFPILHDDVTDLRLVLEDVVIRFDYLGEPSESLKLAYAFDRQTGRLYADGSRVVTHDPEDR
ncbi:MAG: hypothetical protein HOB49_18190 [Gemmatimonadetes bacterium]|nr:hypothetical protein [Gemmatimonadota bacterium]